MRQYARFIPGEEVDAVARWDFGAVDIDGLLLEEKRLEEERAAEAVRAEAIRQAAFAEGLKEGHAQGYEEGLQEAQRRMDEFLNGHGQETARLLGAMVEAARQRLDEVERLAAREALDLVGVMAREVLRHELTVNPNVLLPVIREGMGELLADGKNILIKLNPLDLDMLQDTLQSEFPSQALMFQADAGMTRGGCWIESAGTVVDGTVERRWLRAVRKLGLELQWEEAGDGA